MPKAAASPAVAAPLACDAAVWLQESRVSRSERSGSGWTREDSRMRKARANGVPVPGALLGALRDATALRGDPGALRGRLAEDGYVFVRQAVAPELALAAREQALSRL